jgi:hypothetical protein
MFQSFDKLTLALVMASANLSTLQTGAQAAPIPFTGTSLILNEKPGLYRSPKGFTLNAGRSGWEQASPPADNPFLATVYRKTSGALTVRVDKADLGQSAEDYTKQWMKDYPRLGFEVLGHRTVRVGRETGFLLDLVNRESKVQLRQILFVKNDTVVNLTCRDDVKTFRQSAEGCAEIMKTFSW